MALVHFRPLTDGPLSEPNEKALKARMEAFDKHPHPGVLWYQQVENPSHFYLFLPANGPASTGQSSSITTTGKVYTPKLGTELTEKLASEFDLAVETFLFDVHEAGVQYSSFPFDAPVIAIGKHLISEKDVEGFEKRFGEVKHILEEFTGRPLAKAWRRGAGPPEFFLFSGWGSVQEHTEEFAKSEGWEEWRTLAGYVDVFDLKHGRPFWRKT